MKFDLSIDLGNEEYDLQLDIVEFVSSMFEAIGYSVLIESLDSDEPHGLIRTADKTIVGSFAITDNDQGHK